MRFPEPAQLLRLTAFACFSILVASCGTGDGEDSIEAGGASGAGGNQVLVFRDDFGGPAASPRSALRGSKIPAAPLGAGNWVPDTGYGDNGWGNDEWQLYTDSMDNLFTEDGNLVIRAGCAAGGLYTEAPASQTVNYIQIIDAAVFFGNPTPSNPNSAAVPPLDGAEVLEVDFQDIGRGYGGAIFEIDPANSNISRFTNLTFAIDTSAVAAFGDLVVQLEDGGVAPNVFLSDYTPAATQGNWAIYEIPLADFGGVNLASVTLLGFWNLSSTAGAVNITTGQIYLDGIRFSGCGKRDDSITSARITTKDRLNVRYGTIKARIKMPSGLGMWPAFWTLGSDIDERPWPDAGEIDIVEMHYFFSDRNTTHFSTHYSGPPIERDPNQNSCDSGTASSVNPGETEICETNTKKFDEPLTDDYHIFEVDWNENRIVGKIDGIPYFRQTIDPTIMEEFLKDHYLLLNIAVGGNLGGPNGPVMTAVDWTDPEQTDMLVDWVEVYEYVPPASATLIDESGSNIKYSKITNSVNFGGANVVTDDDSTAQPALVGDTVLEIEFSNSVSLIGGIPAPYSGAAFQLFNLNLSGYAALQFSLDTSRFSTTEFGQSFGDSFFDIGVEFEDGDGNKVEVRTAPAYEIATSGTWVTFEIPLGDFVPVNMNNIVAFGFFNPRDAAGNLVGGTVYVDDIRFVKVPVSIPDWPVTLADCATDASVELDAMTYRPDATLAEVSVSDRCRANKLVSVKVETGGETIFLGVALDAAGDGSAILEFGSPISVCPVGDQFGSVILADPLRATYTVTALDANGVQQVLYEDDTLATIDANATPTEFVGELSYIIANDPNQTVAFAIDVDFNLSDFNTRSSFQLVDDFDFTEPVWQISNSAGAPALFALFNFTSGFAAGQESINFKIKGIQGDIVRVDFSDALDDFVVNLNDPTYSKPIDGTNGWFEVSIPMSNFPGAENHNFLVIKSDILTANGSFLVTDIFLQAAVGSRGPECSAPILAAPTPTEDPADVISLLSNVYSDVFVDTWAQFGSATLLETTLDGTEIKRYSNLGFTGVFTSAGIDISGMTNLRIDVWSAGVSELEVKLVDFLDDGTPGTISEDSVFLPLAGGQWESLDIPLSQYSLANNTDIQQLIFAATGGTGTIFIGNVYYYFAGPPVCPGGAGKSDSPIGFCQDYEAADAADDAVIDDLGVFVAGFDPTNTGFIYGYGGFEVKNFVGPEKIAKIVSGGQDREQGTQSLRLFSDYSNGDHTNGSMNVLRTSTFYEWPGFSPADSGTYTLTFDARLPDSGAIPAGTTAQSSARAFILTLDPNAGFSQSTYQEVVLTDAGANQISTEWKTYSISLVLDGDVLNGHILQAGFRNDANNNNPSAILVDNVKLEAAALPPSLPGNPVANGGFESGADNWALGVAGSTGTGGVTMADAQEGGASLGIQVATPSGTPEFYFFEQAGVEAGNVADGDSIEIFYQLKGTLADGAEIQHSLAWADGGTTGVILPNVSGNYADWTEVTVGPVAVTGGILTGGFNLQFRVNCGGAPSCDGNINIDNIRVRVTTP